MKKSKEIIKGVSELFKKAAPKSLYDSDRKEYDWVYSEIIRVIRLLGGKECGKIYRQDVYSMMCDMRAFRFSHNVAYGKSVDNGDISGYVVTDVDFALPSDPMVFSTLDVIAPSP